MEEKEPTAQELDRTARLCDHIFTFLKAEGLTTPEVVCNETMNATTHIFGIIAEYLNVEPKDFIIGVLQQTIDHINEVEATPINLKTKNGGKITMISKEEKE